MFVVYPQYTRILFIAQMLYGLPVPPNKITDMAMIADIMTQYGGTFRVLIDHPEQVHCLDEQGQIEGRSRRWSVFVKIDAGNKFVVRPDQG
jgi:D-serine ammonia-lyase